MEFRILGPLEVVGDDGNPVVVDRKKTRALLAFLVLHANEAVSSDRLIDELWGEDPPRTATASLQNYISRLRKILGPDVLVSQPPGYVLRIEAEQVDANRFERLVVDARGADPAERAEKLRRALALWRGQPLGDLAYEPFAQSEIRRLEELRMSALEERIDADLALGGGGDLVGEVENLVAQQPLRERLRRQLMLALYRVGRQSDALSAYRDARRMLRDELGIEPSDELQRIERAILVHDPTLQPPPQDALDAGQAAARKTVTILFADLVDSTELAERLDPEALRTVLSGFYAEMGAVIGRHGGTVEKFAGDEVMAVFGAPVTREDDALRAVQAAVEMRRALEALNESLERDLDIRLSLRIGINTGEVVVAAAAASRSLVTGAAVTVAKRLEQAATPGQILVGPATLELVREAVRAEPVGPVALRGKLEPVEPHRILEVIEGAPAIARRLNAPLIGRAQELAALRAELDQVRTERRCRVVAVLGEAGIGKSRLVAELADSVRRDCSVLVGRCVAYGEGATFLPLADIVEQAGPRSQEEIEALLSGENDAKRVAQRVGQLVGLAEGDVPSGEAFWAIRRFFETLARARPLLLVVDDLHWAEPTFVELVEYLAEWIESAPVLVLCTARPDALEQRIEWTPTSSVDLGPLADTDAAALVENLAGVSELVPATAERIVEIAAGNPLFAEQLLAYVAERSPEALADVPPSLEALLASRLDLLDREDDLLLQRAAVVGRHFWPSLVAELTGRDVDHQLRALAAKGFVEDAVSELRGENAMRFHHVLIRDVAYSRITKHERSDLHEQVARWLGRRDGIPDELIGFHLEQAYFLGREAGRPGVDTLAREAAERLGAAGMRALRSADAPTTARLLERATALLPRHDGRRVELLIELAIALRPLGNITRAIEVLREAEAAAGELRDERLRRRAGLELLTMEAATDPEVTQDEIAAAATRSIPVFERSDDQRALGRAWILIGDAEGARHGRIAAWADAAERALVHYERLGWPPVTPISKLAAALYHGPEPVASAIERCAALLDRAAGQLYAEATLLTVMGGLVAQRRRFDEGRTLIAEGAAKYQELGQVTLVPSLCEPLLGTLEMLSGNAAKAESAFRRACDGLEESSHRATQLAQLAEAVYQQGRLDEAHALCRASAAEEAPDDRMTRAVRQGVAAKLRAAAGSHAQAEAAAREAVALVADSDALNIRAQTHIDLAIVLNDAGRTGDAAEAALAGVTLYREKGNVAAAQSARRLAEQLAPV